MKKLTILFTLALFTFISKAQITLDSANFKMSVNATDILDNFNDTFNFTILPERGANINWNYGSVLYLKLVSPVLDTTDYSAPPANSIFKSATRSCAQSFPNYELSTFSANYTAYFTDMASGYACTGYSTQRQAYGHPQQGGSDSLIYLPFDTTIAGNPQYILKYPAAYDSNWAYNARLTYHIQLYINPPPSNYYFNGLEIVYRSVFDSVVGWGNMVVPYDNNGNMEASVAYPVIMVKEIWTDIDSFRIAGLPGYNAEDVEMLLRTFGINQGQKNGYYTYTFYRAGYSAPLFKFWAFDMPYNVAAGAGFDPNNTAPYTGIKTTPIPTTGLTISPNPFTTTLSIAYTLPQPQAVQLTLTDITGKQIATLASENQNPGPHTYTLSAAQYSISPGIYFLRMVAGANAVTQKIVRLR